MKINQEDLLKQLEVGYPSSGIRCSGDRSRGPFARCSKSNRTFSVNTLLLLLSLIIIFNLLHTSKIRIRAAHKRRPQSGWGEGLSVRTFVNKGGSSDAEVRTFWCKKSEFFKISIVTARTRVEEVELVRKFYGQGGGVNFSQFCVNVFHGRLLKFQVAYEFLRSKVDNGATISRFFSLSTPSWPFPFFPSPRRFFDQSPSEIFGYSGTNPCWALFKDDDLPIFPKKAYFKLWGMQLSQENYLFFRRG